MSDRDILEQCFDESAGSFLERTQVTLERFVRAETFEMTNLFCYWRELRIERDDLPRLGDMAQKQLLHMNIVNNLNIIDVSVDNPEHYRIELQSMAGCVESGIDLLHQPISHHPCPLHARGLQLDYFLVKTRKVPRYHMIRQNIDGMYRHYARIILPLSDDGKIVNRLLSGVRLVEPISGRHRPLQRYLQ